uniref:Uncharacterized protein n=1 Tax=Arundo donax TaxID=35708 RepID=A0A0A9CD94_ARUDO
MARGAPFVIVAGERDGILVLDGAAYITSSDTHPKSGPSSSVAGGSTGATGADAAAAFLKQSSRIASISSSISASASTDSSMASSHLRPCTGDTGGDSQRDASVDLGESDSGE